MSYRKCVQPLMQWPASDLFLCFNSQHKNLRSSSITAQLTGSGPLETSGDTVHTPVPFLPPVPLDAPENRYLYPVSYLQEEALRLWFCDMEWALGDAICLVL